MIIDMIITMVIDSSCIPCALVSVISEYIH